MRQLFIDYSEELNEAMEMRLVRKLDDRHIEISHMEEIDGIYTVNEFFELMNEGSRGDEMSFSDIFMGWFNYYGGLEIEPDFMRDEEQPVEALCA